LIVKQLIQNSKFHHREVIINDYVQFWKMSYQR